MQPKTNYLLTVLFAVVGLCQLTTGDKKCDRNVMDNCSQKLLMIGDENFVFPTNMDEMNKRCKQIKPLERCVKEYSQKCLESTTKQSISVLTYSITKTNKGYCTTTKRKNAFISFGNCANKNLKKVNKFMGDLNKDFHAIRGYSDKTLRIPLACCNYFRFKERIMNLIAEECAEQSGEIENLVDGYARDVLNLLCGDYTEESDKCKHIIGKTPKWTKQLEWKVFINPMVEILNSV